MERPREKGGKVVFIGNIPYGVSEEQICELFASAGQVVNFRLVYDKETGRPKGFGFLEYTNVDDAASAVRNLNEHEIMGRTLRVDYSNDNGGGAGNRNNDQKQNQGMPQPPPFGMGMPPPNGQPDTADALPPLPQGTALQDGLSAPDAISRTLSTLPAPQLLDIISQMKGLCATEPAKATALLQQAPQLAYAIFQALLSLGLVDSNVLTSLLQQVPPQQQQPPPQQQQAPPQQPPPMPYQPPGMPPQYGQQQPQFPPPPHQHQQFPPPPQQHQQHYAPTPPVQHQAYQPPPQQHQQQAPPQPPSDPNQQALIAQVMAMTRDQIFALDPAARDQIMALRASWGAPVS